LVSVYFAEETHKKVKPESPVLQPAE
jgi:hypothetical protein